MQAEESVLQRHLRFYCMHVHARTRCLYRLSPAPKYGRQTLPCLGVIKQGSASHILPPVASAGWGGLDQMLREPSPFQMNASFFKRLWFLSQRVGVSCLPPPFAPNFYMDLTSRPGCDSDHVVRAGCSMTDLINVAKPRESFGCQFSLISAI